MKKLLFILGLALLGGCEEKKGVDITRERTRRALLNQVGTGIRSAANNGVNIYCFNTEWHPHQSVLDVYKYYSREGYNVNYSLSEDNTYIQLCIDWSPQ